MRRLGHGDQISPALTASAATPGRPDYDFVFKGLRTNPGNLLPVSPATVPALKALGTAMEDFNPESPAGNSTTIPAAYTYLGQFIDHDITLQSPHVPITDINDPNLTPLPDPAKVFTNQRSPWLDLDCVYGPPAPTDPADARKMQVGKVTAAFTKPAGKSDFNDVPRLGPSTDPGLDRAALIGDPRNDENLIIAQLQVAFLRAHNALVANGAPSHAAAATQLRQHFQHIVLGDFLKRSLDNAVLNDVIANGPRFFTPKDQTEFFIPFEFAAAAYRFGHSQVRAAYDYNVNFPNADFRLLFVFTALSGQLGGTPTLPHNWIIEWDRLLPLTGGAPSQFTRKLDSKLAEPLAHLTDTLGDPLKPPMERLAVRNLLRGYLLGLPTGQAIATAMGLAPLTGPALLAAVPADQRAVLTSGGFDTRTPLWFYIMAEAGNPAGPAGEHLGPVGSRIVAETLWNIIRLSPDSIIGPNGTLTGAPFTLADLIKLSGNGT